VPLWRGSSKSQHGHRENSGRALEEWRRSRTSWPVAADAPNISDWQRFTARSLAGDYSCLVSFHGRFLTANSNGEITADAIAIGDWQKFKIVRNSDDTDSVALQAWSGKFITAHKNGHLNASASAASGWEAFWEYDNYDGTVSFKSIWGKFIAAKKFTGTEADVGDMQETFQHIYAANAWQYGSGYGSLPQNTVGYRLFLQKFVRERHVRSVLDVGCGDWQFSRLMDWNGIDYLGVDIVPSVIEQDTDKYATDGIRFQQGSATEELPTADLLVIREVLQHLPYGAIFAFLQKNALSGRYRFVLMSNEMNHPGELNTDAKAGGQVPARGLDLSAPPFNVPGLKIMYTHGETQTVLLSNDLKE
jgi:hypothetical protein